MLISRSTCAPRLESSCSSNTLMKEDSGYRKYSYGKQRFLPAWFDKISRIFSFFLLPFFFFFFFPLLKIPERVHFLEIQRLLISLCPLFLLFLLPFYVSLSLSLFRIFPILDALHHPSLPPLNGTSSRFLHQREGKNCKNTS